MDSHYYIALDADVIRNLTKINNYLTKNPDCTYKQICDYFKDNSEPYSSVVKNFTTYWNLLEIAKDENSQIRLEVTTTPYYQVQHRPLEREFIKKYCYTPDVESLRRPEVKTEIIKLAYAYCEEFINPKDGVKFYFPLSMEWNPEQEKFSPSTDTYALAEAVHSRAAFFLTENKRHFIDVVSEEKKSSESNSIGKGRRRKAIVKINIDMGYAQNVEDDLKYEMLTTVPISVKELKDRLKDFNKGKLACLKTSDDELKIVEEMFK